MKYYYNDWNLEHLWQTMLLYEQPHSFFWITRYSPWRKNHDVEDAFDQRCIVEETP